MTLPTLPDPTHIRYWFRASDEVFSDNGSTPAADGDGIYRINNQGEAADNAIQATSARRPIYKTGGENGLPFIRCNYNDQQYFDDLQEGDHSTGITVVNPYTIFLVVKNVRVNGPSRATVFGPNVSNSIRKCSAEFYDNGGVDGIRWCKVAVHQNTDSDNFNIICIATHGGALVSKFMFGDLNNTLAEFTSNANAASNANSTMQFLRAGGLYWFDGDLYEAIYYDSYLGLTDAQAVLDELQGVYDSSVDPWNISNPTVLDDDGLILAPRLARPIRPGVLDDDGLIRGMRMPQVKVAPAIPFEWNPHRPDVPGGLAESDPEQYQYLREQAETIREQHNVTQAGDTTFPWEKMFQTSVTRAYTLGAITRFAHPVYGVFLARYVKFSDRGAGSIQGPVGRDKKYDDWVVTDDINKSDPMLLAGISLPYESEVAGLYGWAMIQGRGLFSILVESEEPLEAFQRLTWSEETAGYCSTGAGRALGYILDTQWIREILDGGESIEPRTWSVPAAAWGVDLEGVTPEYIKQQLASQLGALDERLIALETAEAPEIPDYSSVFQSITAHFAALDQGLESESVTRYNADRETNARIDTIVGPAGGETNALLMQLTDRVTHIEDVYLPKIDGITGRVDTLEVKVSALKTWQSAAEDRLIGIEHAVGIAIRPALVGGTGISITNDPVANTDTIALNGINEIIDDRVAALLVAGTGVTLTYNDPSGTLTIDATGGGGGGAPTVGYGEVNTVETRNVTSYGNLTTAGPAVTITTGTSVLVIISCKTGRSVAGTGNTGFAAVEVSGATTIAAADGHSVSTVGLGNAFYLSLSAAFVLTGLTPGSNVFTMKYRVDGSTFGFQERRLTIIPL